MRSSYSLSNRQAMVCQIAAILFAIAALIRAASVALLIVAGNGAVTGVKCGDGGCYTVERPDLLLPESERSAVTSSPAAAAKLADYVKRPWVRALLATIDLAAAGPFVLLMLFVSKATWRLGSRKEGDFDRALPWLRRASVAALALALVPPVTDSLRAMLLFHATPTGPSWYLEIDIGPLLTGLLLAFAAFIVSWALAVGSRARADVAEFV